MRSGPSLTAVLGAGHGGMALASYLALHGHRVALWSRSPASTASVASLGGIRLTLPDGSTEFAPVELATWSMAAVLEHARRVVVAVPACAHADVARRCAPYLRDGQTVLLVPGRTGGALEFRRVLWEAGCRARILLGETSTFPFASRATGPTSATIFGIKNDLLAAALPAACTPQLVETWKPLLPMLSPAESVMHTGLMNFGAILHPIITLLNAQRIKARESFDFYTDGVTPGVASVLEDADAERLEIADYFDTPTLSLTEWIARSYGHEADTVQEAVGDNPSYVGIKAPTTLEHRYLLEDVPTGLFPLIALAGAAGLAVPTLRRLVALAESTLGRRLDEGARTLRALGLAGRGVGEICSLVEGEGPPVRGRLVRMVPPPARVLDGALAS